MSVVQHAGRLRLDGDTPVSLHLQEDNRNTLGWVSVIVSDMAVLVAVESTTCSYRKISYDSKDIKMHLQFATHEIESFKIFILYTSN